MSVDNLNKLIAEFEEEGFDKVKLGGFDIDGVLRGKYVSLDKFKSAAKSGLGFCDVIFGWDCADELYEGVPIEVTGWHTGYPDADAAIDLSTLRRIPWEDDQPLFILDFKAKDGSPLEVSPRQLCKKVAALSEAMGFEAKTSAEFEFWLFDETPHSVRDKGYRDLTPLTPGMFGYSATRASLNSGLFSQIVSGMRLFGVPIEGIHTETGPGVLEAALTYDNMVDAADCASLFKTGMKEICGINELMITFMAKWSAKLPGSSGHLHQSLWADGENVFYDSNDPMGMSQTFKHYLAGVLETMPEFTALYAPTINSYRRLVPGMWAPTRACWAPENRTASMRTIHGPKPSSTRLELRVTGADINPYIAMSASVAAGLYGIKHKLELRPRLQGNAYTASHEDAPPLPGTLSQAIETLHKSDAAREMLGDAFINHYCATRQWEVMEAAKIPTDWEIDRYFEII